MDDTLKHTRSNAIPFRRARDGLQWASSGLGTGGVIGAPTQQAVVQWVRGAIQSGNVVRAGLSAPHHHILHRRRAVHDSLRGSPSITQAPRRGLRPDAHILICYRWCAGSSMCGWVPILKHVWPIGDCRRRTG